MADRFIRGQHPRRGCDRVDWRDQCRDCKGLSVSREGWCLTCLRQHLDRKFGKVNLFSRFGDSRTGEMKQKMLAHHNDDNPSPWEENAVRDMEDRAVRMAHL